MLAKRAFWHLRSSPMIAASSHGEALFYALRGRTNVGACPICEAATLFVKKGSWLREQYLCLYCNSIPRYRALMLSLGTCFPAFREMAILEVAPDGPVSEKLRRECRQYIPARLLSGVPLGKSKDGIRCEDLRKLTLDDESVDLVITQDVLEHVLNPAKAFAEITRVLKPGGAHVFTVPYYASKMTHVRAQENSDGVDYLDEKEYHGITELGSLVVTEWGRDLPEFIFRHGGMYTSIYRTHDSRLGLDGEFLEVFVSRKAR